MSKSYDLTKATLISTGTLPKSGGDYALVLQSVDHIDDILAMQKLVYDDLPADDKEFIVPKDRAFFEKHLASGNYVVGIVHDGRLIGQGILLQPTTQNPKTGMVDMCLDTPPEKIAVIQGLLVDPAFRGNGLMTLMVDARLDLAHRHKRTDLIAEVAVENHHSWSVLMKEGMHIHSIGTDPSDGTIVYNLHAKVEPLIKKRLKPDFNKAAARKNTVDCNKNDLQKQKELLAKGYLGVSFNAANDNITFKKASKKHISNGPKLS